jgi:hypothetical protein
MKKPFKNYAIFFMTGIDFDRVRLDLVHEGVGIWEVEIKRNDLDDLFAALQLGREFATSLDFGAWCSAEVIDYFAGLMKRSQENGSE